VVIDLTADTDGEDEYEIGLDIDDLASSDSVGASPLPCHLP